MALNEMQKKDRSEYLEKNLVITECSQKEPYVFISYASDNWEQVFKSVVVPLQNQFGMRVYADKAFDKVNDKWIVPMLRNVRGADVIIAFVSQSYIESYACFLELLTALNNKKQVVFVSLEENLCLGDTTDQPVIERGVKNEILNQGSNIATNTNNTSNDIMRAIKSAYTSLSTLLEQDALSKYDISDAFINFFRDASVNRKSVHDLNAIKRTVKSISSEVFDVSYMPKDDQESSAPVSEVSEAGAAGEISTADEAGEIKTVTDTGDVSEQPSVTAASVEEPASKVAFSFNELNVSQEPGQSDEQPKSSAVKGKVNKKIIIGAAAAVLVIGIIVAAVMLFGNSGGKTFIDGTYTGELADGVPNGQGTMTYYNEDIYEGEWQSGKRNGQGKIIYADGAVYEGEWQNDLRNGQGTLTFANGDVYEGEWKDDVMEGTGTLRFNSGKEAGTLYTGEWQAGLKNGQGTMTYANGDIYIGEWQGDQRSGQGTVTYANGDIYKGEWQDDLRSGQGTMTYANGDLYEGEWIEDVMEGYGIFHVNSGENAGNVYEGEWQDGQRSGRGTMTYASGSVYEGDWLNDQRDGQGLFSTAAGEYYIGEWWNDKATGQGVFTYNGDYFSIGEWGDSDLNGLGINMDANGKLYIGEWEDGVGSGKGISVDPEGNISHIGTWSDGYFQEELALEEVSFSDGNYTGELKDGEPNGIGIMEYGNGNTFMGMWSEGKTLYGYYYYSNDGAQVFGPLDCSYYSGSIRDGYGVFIMGYGSAYLGEYRNDSRNGLGMNIYITGSVYVGEWKNGTTHGQGTMTDTYGNVQSGTWENGVFIESASDASDDEE